MGPYSRFIFGTAMTIWAVLGLVLLVGSIMAIALAPQVVKQIQEFSVEDLMGAATTEQGQGTQNSATGKQMGMNLSGEVRECVEEEIGKDRVQALQNGSLPNDTDKKTLAECGFTPANKPALSGQQPQPSQQAQPIQ